MLIIMALTNVEHHKGQNELYMDSNNMDKNKKKDKNLKHNSTKGLD